MENKDTIQQVFLEKLKNRVRSKLQIDPKKEWGIQRRIAKELGVSDSIVQRWFAGSFPTPEYLLQIHKVFGISPNELLGIESAHFLQNSKRKSTISDDQISHQARPIPLESEGLYVSVMICENLDQLAKIRPVNDILSPRINLPTTITGFDIVPGGRYGMTVIKGKTGMEPKIKNGDAILVNFSDVTIREEDINEDKIYLVQYKNRILLRYVTFQDSVEGKVYMFSREGGKSILVLLNGQSNPILGHVIWVCRKL